MGATRHKSTAACVVIARLHCGIKIRNFRGWTTKTRIHFQNPLAARLVCGRVSGEIGIDNTAALGRPDQLDALVESGRLFYDLPGTILGHSIENAIPPIFGQKVLQDLGHERIYVVLFISERSNHAQSVLHYLPSLESLILTSSGIL